MIVFSQNWFKKYNKQLCWLANSFIGDFIFKISKMGHDKKKYGKITEMHPNAITHKQRLLYNFETHKIEQEYTTQFFSRNEYALRLQKIFYPIWLTFHAWDMLIANPFKPAWNLGFDTLTQYPGSISANNPIDGSVDHEQTLTWANIVAGAGTHFNNYWASDNLFLYQCSASSPNWNQLLRSIFCFDTSSIDDSANISNSVLSFYGESKYDEGGSTPNVNIYSSSPASTTTLANSDYANLGGTAFCDTPITYAGFSTSGYNDFTMNATGIAAVDKTGISKFGARNANYDVANSSPGWTAGADYSRMRCYFSNNATNKPKLVVTYTAAVADNSIFFGCNF